MSEFYHVYKILSNRYTPGRNLPAALLGNRMHAWRRSAPTCPTLSALRQLNQAAKCTPHNTVSPNECSFLNLALYPLDSPSPVIYRVWLSSCPIYRVNIKFLGSIMWDFLAQ